jgi:hypothetical protein
MIIVRATKADNIAILYLKNKFSIFKTIVSYIECR